MDLIRDLVGKFCNLVIDLTWEQLRYLIYYHRNIDQLCGQLTELTLKRSSIQHRIDVAENNVEQIEDEVLHWLEEVDAISEQLHELRRESEAKSKCGIASCPNLLLRYKLSKGAEKIAREAAAICGKGNFMRVGNRVPPQSMQGSTNRESNREIDSRVKIKNHIMEALRNPRFNMIGLCGLGGVGKTTIAIDIEKEEENQKVFKKVIMATVSQEINIGQIQDQIIQKLGMQLNESIESVKASRLCERLKKEENMLLILDDLWKELDLGKVGIPFVDDEKDRKINEGCKILLTSRDETLLSKCMKCQKIITVDDLSEDEAWELFQSIAKPSIESSNADLKSIATEIVQKCGRLPLAIATAAKALKDQSIDGWRDYLLRLKGIHPLARSITGIKEVDNVLKLSYDALSQENKDIFLLSAMLSHDPSIEDLLMYSVGLDIFKHTQNMGDARNAIFLIVGKLKSANLFLDSFSSHHFTMHDLYRDVALSIASKELNAVIVRHSMLDDWPDKSDLECCKRICLQECDICDLPKELSGPKLEFFLLNSKKSDLTIPNMFFKSLQELKVLAITKVNFLSLPLLSFLQRLKVLCLHSCLLEDITEIRSLKKLKVLSLAYSLIKQLPVELAELTSLQMLNLSHCYKLKVIPQKLLSSLKKLEVLYMPYSFNQWKVQGSNKADENASLDELMGLPISSLEIHIPNLSMLPENLFLKMDLRRYRIFIGKRWTWWESNYVASKILKLELESSINWMAGLRNLSKGVEDLHLCGSNGQENVLYNLDASGFPCLRHLRIESNHDIKYIVLNSAHHEHAFPFLESLELKNLKALENLCEGPNDFVFGQLHTLKMENLPALTGDYSIKDRATKNASNKIFKSLFNKVLLPKLEILELFNLNSLIWDDQLLHNSFNNLKTLRVEKCGFVKLVPLHVLISLNNLEELDVKDCDMLEIVFDFEDLNDYCKEMESSSVVVPLKKLRLKNLSKLKNVWSNHYQRNVSFPGPRSVDADGCVSLTSIFPASIAKVLLPKLEILELSNINSLIPLIWDDQLLHNSFRNLKTLTVEKCGFVKLVPLHVLKYLNNLEKVAVKSCDILEIVFDFEDLNDCYKKMDLSSLVMPLKKLELWNLPKLKNVWSNNWQGNISFPSLRSIKVYNCESFTSIFPASIAKGMLGDLEELQISYCSIDVIVAKDQVSESVGAAFQFPRLTSLQLGHLPQLTNFYPQRHTIERPLFQQLEISEKEVSGSSEIYEEENTLDSKYPLQSHNKVLPKLEILKLSELNSLIPWIWDDQLLYNSFNNLKTLTVEKCGFLKLVPLHVLKSLNNLEKVEIISCDMLEIVFDFEDFNDYYKEMDSLSVVVPLKMLTLHNLPKLKNVWSNNWQGNVSFPSLRSVYVNDCVSLTSIFPASIAKGMLCNLEELKIYRCGVDVIVAEGQVSEYVPVTFRFPNLTSLVLSGLPNLRNFYPQKHTLEWSQLSQLSIQCCDELEIFDKKEVSSSSEIYEEENMLDSKYPLLPHDEVIRNLERLTLQGKQVEKIGSGQFLMYHFPKLMLLHLSLEKIPCNTYWERSPNLGELKLSGNFEKFVEGNNNVAALHFPKLTLTNISNMRSLSPSLVSPPNLTHLKMDCCFEWTTLITSSIARSLVHLTHLLVSNCYQIEEIITKQEGEDDENGEIFFNKMKVLEFVHLSRLRRFCCHNYSFRFPLLEHVNIRGCFRLTMFCPGAIHAPQLQRVNVNEFDSRKDIWMTDLNNTIQHLVTSKEGLSTTESMAINAENITRIVDVFPNVSRLYVESFTDEGVTFPYSSLEKFPKLIWLQVEHCSFEEIFPSQDQIIDFMGKIPPFERLDIAYMDKLKSIWKDDSQLPPIHQNLSYLFIKSCCSLVKLAPSSASFQNLHVLNVSKCHQLINLVTTSTAKSLVGLKHLEINDCKSMEEIVMNDTDEDVQAGITFNQLHKIKLTDMPSLKMFSPQSHTFEFPELKTIEISRCPGMKKFCPGVLKTPKLSKVKIEEHHMKWKDEGDFNKTMEGLSSAKDSINI